MKLKLSSPLACGTLGILALVLAGCPGDAEFRELGERDDVVNTAPHAHHHHHDHGPHGGHIIELGNYHGELVMDEARKVTFYLLGEDAKTPAPLADASVVLRLELADEELRIPLQPDPLEGETGGESSRYVAAPEAIPATVTDIEEVHGSVDLTIGGVTKSGKIDHDHHHH